MTCRQLIEDTKFKVTILQEVSALTTKRNFWMIAMVSFVQNGVLMM